MNNLLKGKLTDIVLILFAVYMLFTVNWSNVLPHQRVLLMIYSLCIVLKIGNRLKNKKNIQNNSVDSNADSNINNDTSDTTK